MAAPMIFLDKSLISACLIFLPCFSRILPSTTAALSATGALKRANELNGDGNEPLSHELGAVAARTTKPESVQPNE
jgi:hypothetical protein